MNVEALLPNLMGPISWVLQTAILLRMVRSKLRDELPMLFAYVLFAECRSISLYWIRVHFGFRSPEYFVGYWLGFVVHTGLELLVIREVYAKVLHRYAGLRTLSDTIFRWAMLLLVVLGFIIAASSPAADRDAMYSGILLLDRSVMIVEFGLMVLLFVFSRALELGWRECIFGIAVGLCFYCTTELAAVSLRTYYRNDAAELYSMAEPFLTLIMLGVWTTYVYRSDRARQPGQTLSNLRMTEWNDAVLQFLNR